MADDLRRTPQQDRSRRSLDAILDATAALLAETDPSTLTMSAIGERAGVSKAAIYRYYPDRPAVIRALAQRYLEPMSNVLGEPLADGDADSVERAVDAYVAYFEAEPVVKAIWVTGFSFPEIGVFCAEFDRQLASLVVERACDEVTPEVTRRAYVMVRALRSTIELASLEDEAAGQALIEELKRIFRGQALGSAT